MWKNLYTAFDLIVNAVFKVAVRLLRSGVDVVVLLMTCSFYPWGYLCFLLRSGPKSDIHSQHIFIKVCMPTTGWLQSKIGSHLRPLHTTHKTEKVFLKSCCENRCPYAKLLKTSLQRKKVVVCMEDKCIFCSYVCSVRRSLLSHPYSRQWMQ